MTIPLSLLIAHFIGDFLLQSDWMALNKSKNWGALAAHSYVYAMSMLLAPIVGWDASGNFALAFIAITFVTHFITDAVTSRITSKLWFIELYNPGDCPKEFEPHTHIGPYTFYNDALVKSAYRHWFFVVIGLDQLIHFGTLAWTLRLLTH